MINYETKLLLIEKYKENKGTMKKKKTVNSQIVIN